MTKKKTPKDPKSIHVQCNSEADAKKLMAKTILRPTVTAATTIKAFNDTDERIDATALVDELSGQTRLIGSGDMSRVEAMLITQAHTLDCLFCHLLHRSKMNMGQHLDAMEAYMKLALRTQSQCRATLETLAMVKNPQPYVRQQNVAYNQQVNNGGQPQQDHARAGEKLNSTNGLLEDKTHETEWLDGGTTEKAGGDDKELATVDAQHRPKDGSR